MARVSKAKKRPVGRPKSTRERKQTTVYLSPAVHKAAKVRAAESELLLSDVVERALVKFLRLPLEVSG